MKRVGALQLALSLAVILLLAGCGGDTGKNPAAEAPPAAQVEHEGDASIVQVDNASQFPLATAAEYRAAPQLVVTGVVSPDVSRTVPVISIASGRVVEIRARLGDTVKKGQLLLRVQSADIAAAYSDYRKAVASEVLAKTQLDRATGLYDHGAISLNDFQVAQDTENKAKVDVETTAEHLKVLGAPLDHPSGIVDIVAPIAGVITDQQVTNAAGIQGPSSTNPFTISDLSEAWIVCDVYENDLSNVRVGDSADVRLNAYPDQVVTGKISNIGAVLDPNIRTAKVRIQVQNPATCARERSQPPPSAGKRKKPMPRCQPRRSCTCTIAIGFTPRRAEINFGAWESSPAEFCRAMRKKSSLESSRRPGRQQRSSSLQNTVEQ